MLRFIVLMVILVAPVAQGSHGLDDAALPGGTEIIEWRYHVYSAFDVESQVTSNWTNGEVLVNVSRPHGQTVVSSESRLAVSVTANANRAGGVTANQNRLFLVSIEGQVLEYCNFEFRVRSQGGLSVDAPGMTPYLGGLECPTVEFTQTSDLFVVGVPQNWSFTSSGTLGSASIDGFKASVYVVVQDVVDMSEVTVITALDPWLPFVILFALIVVAAWRGWGIVIYPATVGMILFLFDPPLMPLQWIWAVIIVFFSVHALREIYRVRSDE